MMDAVWLFQQSRVSDRLAILARSVTRLNDDVGELTELDESLAPDVARIRVCLLDASSLLLDAVNRLTERMEAHDEEHLLGPPEPS